MASWIPRWCPCRRRLPVARDASFGEFRQHLPEQLKLTDPLTKLINHWQRHSHNPNPLTPLSTASTSTLNPHSPVLFLVSYEEVLMFWQYFRKLDKDASGTVDPLEFFAFLHEPRTRVLNYIIPIIANDPTNYQMMDFSSWMLALFGFCFMTEEELIQHVFQRYDSSGTGRLLQNDLYKFLKQMHADNPLFPKDIVIDISTALNLRGYFDYDRFYAMSHKYPMLFYPVIRIQRAMRDSIIGPRLFKSLDKRTMDIYYLRRPGDRPPLYFLLKLKSRLRRFITVLPCWRPRRAKMEARQEAREWVRREKLTVERRRHGGVAGELYEEKKGEREFLRARAPKKRKKQGDGEDEDEEDEEEEEEEVEVPSVLRRKYFGVDEEGGEEKKVERILERLKAVVHSHALDTYDSDNDTDEDHFEDKQVDEYEDASQED